MLVLKLCEQLCPDKIPVATSTKLGDGADGEVFDIADQPNQVIKFCVLYQRGSRKIQDQHRNIQKALSHLQSNPEPTFARVYSSGLMGQFERDVWDNKKQPFLLYYYTMEKLYSVTEDEKKVFHSILSHEDGAIEKNFPDDKIKEMIFGMATCLDFDAEKVYFFCTNIKNSQVTHLDVHVRNIMKDSDGNFKLIDFDRVQMRR